MTDRYAVIGNPVAHSLSPRIHAAFARQTGQDIDYGLLEAPVDGFVEAVQKFRNDGGRGLNVTVPFKLDAFAFATSLTERAQSAGAVNTLKFDGDKTIGDNTDGAGLIADITRRLGVSLRGKRVLMLGAGGAARGVMLPLLQQEPAVVAIANRTVGKAIALAERWAHAGNVRGGGYGDFARQRFDVVINATSTGLGGGIPPIADDALDGATLAYDMLYGEKAKAFLNYAKARGVARVADGVGMLIAQAAESFYLWRGVRPDVEPVIETFGT